MQPLIKVEHVSKSYDEQVVLKDITFSVSQGDFLGIIGPNGAGKSTLLSIIAGITTPDQGQVEINGNLTSILDVGAGFHPDLTGRDNIFLVSALYGFSKKSVEEKVLPIIKYSESENHIDRPVKTYSSGMYLRLAFAIFIHLDFDVLLLDEVLGVGDFDFQLKAKNTLNLMKNKGKTIVLVTHNLTELAQYCNKVIYLNKEIQHESSDIHDGIIYYLGDNPSERKEHDQRDLNLKYDNIYKANLENKWLKINTIHFEANGQIQQLFVYSDEIEIVVDYACILKDNKLAFVVKLFDVFDNMILCDSECFRQNYTWEPKNIGRNELRITLPKEFLGKGKYFLNLLLINDDLYEAAWHGIANFEVKLDSWMNKQVWAGINTGTLPQLSWENTSTDLIDKLDNNEIS